MRGIIFRVTFISLKLQLLRLRKLLHKLENYYDAL